MKRTVFPFGKIIGGYKIVKLIGRGGYGDIYYALRVSDNFPVALKTESTTAFKQSIQYEMDITSKLKNSNFVPIIYDVGEDQSCRYIAMELLGPSLASLISVLHTFSLFTVLKLAISMLKAVEAFHECGFIHNDIKPDNFLLKPPNSVKIIDFGFNKPYIDDDGQLLPRKSENEHFGGTASYASPSLLKHFDTGRKDDMYSWFYSVYALLYKHFPWEGIKKTSKLRRMKKRFPKSEEFEKMPTCLKNIYNHILTLKFKDRPDYEYCIKELENYFISENVDEKQAYDWESLTNDQVKSFSVFPLNGTAKEPFREEELVNIPKLMKEQENEAAKREANRSKREQASTVCILI